MVLGNVNIQRLKIRPGNAKVGDFSSLDYLHYTVGWAWILLETCRFCFIFYTIQIYNLQLFVYIFVFLAFFYFIFVGGGGAIWYMDSMYTRLIWFDYLRMVTSIYQSLIVQERDIDKLVTTKQTQERLQEKWSTIMFNITQVVLSPFYREKKKTHKQSQRESKV